MARALPDPVTVADEYAHALLQATERTNELLQLLLDQGKGTRPSQGRGQPEGSVQVREPAAKRAAGPRRTT